MAVIQLTAREFREKQASVFNLIDAGEQVIIHRGKKKTYALVPFDEGLEVTAELQSEIDAALAEIANGECISFNNFDEIKKHFEALRCTK